MSDIEKSGDKVRSEDVEDTARRAFLWMAGNDCGLSSKAIAGHMVYGVCDGSFPLDPSDAGRCFRLLELFPEWQGRITEMGKYGLYWKRLAARWDEVRDTMEEEVGIHWEKSGHARKTYALMEEILYETP